MRKTVLLLIFSGGLVTLCAATPPTFKGFLHQKGQLIPNCLIGACGNSVQRSVDNRLPDVLEQSSKEAESSETATNEPPRREGFIDTEVLQGAAGVYRQQVQREMRSYRDRVSKHRESYRKRAGEFELLQ